MSYKVTRSDPKGKASYIQLSAAVSGIKAVFSASYRFIFAADVRLGLYLLRVSISDSFGASDTFIQKDFGKVVTDFSYARDDLNLATFKLLLDNGLVLESDTKSIGKNLRDNGLVSESDVKSVGKNLQDTGITSDSGSMLWQSYVNNPYYFAEDYVGGKQLF